MESVRTALSCLPCFPRPLSPEIEDQNAGRDELEGLLADADDAGDTLSLHSSIGRRKGKKGRAKGKKNSGWGIPGRNQKSGGKKTVQLFGYHLFGRPAPDEAISSEDDEEELPGESPGPGPSSTPARSTTTLDSDAAPIGDATIARLASDTQDQWKPPQSEEELAREERELAEAEEAAAGPLGVQSPPPAACDSTTKSPPKDTARSENDTQKHVSSPSPHDASAPSPKSAPENPGEAPNTTLESEAEHAQNASTPSDEERAARHAKEIRRALRAQRKRLKQAAEAEAEAAAGGFDFGRQPTIQGDGAGFEGFQGSGEDGVIVLPPHLTSSTHDDEYGPFVHYEGSTTSTTESVSSSSRARSRPPHYNIEPLTAADLSPSNENTPEDANDYTDYGLEYVNRAQPKPQGRGSASGSTSHNSSSLSGANKSDNGRWHAHRSDISSRAGYGLVNTIRPQHVPLPPSSAGSDYNGHSHHWHDSHNGAFDSHPHQHIRHQNVPGDSIPTKHKKSHSRASNKPTRSEGSIHSRSSLVPPHAHPDYPTRFTQPLANGVLSNLPQHDTGFEGVPGGGFSSLEASADELTFNPFARSLPQRTGFEGAPGDF